MRSPTPPLHLSSKNTPACWRPPTSSPRARRSGSWSRFASTSATPPTCTPEEDDRGTSSWAPGAQARSNGRGAADAGHDRLHPGPVVPMASDVLPDPDTPTTSRLPNDSAYAVTTHCRSLLEKPSACWADGSAMFTIVASSTSISWATATTTRTSQRRSADAVRRSRVAEGVLTDDIRSIPSLRLAELARLSVRGVRLDSEGIW